MFESPRRNSASLKPSLKGIWLTVGSFIVCLGFVLTPWKALAQNPELNNAPLIFDVRRSLPLEPDEPVYHDFYINAGVEAGFKKGMYITVVRLIPVHDPLQNKQQGELQVGVARLQFIQVARNLSVARLHSEFTNEERPALEFEAVMIGDRVDPSTMTMQAPAQKKKKTAQAIEEEHETLASVAPASTEPQAQQVQSMQYVQPALPAQTPWVGQEIQPQPFDSGAAVVTRPTELEVHQTPTSAVEGAVAMASTGVPIQEKNTSQSATQADIVRVPVPASTGSLNVRPSLSPSM